ncbi:hypothetical protein GJU40_20410, partial [Bacillus lacus]
MDNLVVPRINKEYLTSIIFAALFLIGGCGVMGGISETPEERHARKTFISVNDYVGEGFDCLVARKTTQLRRKSLK